MVSRASVRDFIKESLEAMEEDRFASPCVIKAFRFGERSEQRYLGVICRPLSRRMLEEELAFPAACQETSRLSKNSHSRVELTKLRRQEEDGLRAGQMRNP